MPELNICIIGGVLYAAGCLTLLYQLVKKNRLDAFLCVMGWVFALLMLIGWLSENHLRTQTEASLTEYKNKYTYERQAALTYQSLYAQCMNGSRTAQEPSSPIPRSGIE